MYEIARCPRCTGDLQAGARSWSCVLCNAAFPVVGGIPCLFDDAAVWLGRWCAAIESLDGQLDRAAESRRGAEAMRGLLPATRDRLLAQIEAMAATYRTARDILVPALSPHAGRARSNQGGGGGGTDLFKYIDLLQRDWGWSEAESDENRVALERMKAATKAPLGRVLVLGAGGCRLAYDLHRIAGAAATVVLDVDPLLLLVARTVIGGGAVELTESPIQVGRTSETSAVRTLRVPPGGPTSPPGFHFVFADGLRPPFPDGSFDTVFTPWFIDQVPRDLRDLIGEVHRLLPAGGRWINYGPLIYAEDTPVAARFSWDEIAMLLDMGGFAAEYEHDDSGPYLQSPLNRRGKLERVFTWSARKLKAGEGSSRAAGGTASVGPSGWPPAWLLLPHLPVPAIPPGAPPPENPLARSVRAEVDGARSIDAIARRLASAATPAGATPAASLKDAIREALAAAHAPARGANDPGR